MSELIPLSAPALSGRPSPLDSLRSLAAQPALHRALPALGTVSALLMAGAAWYAFQSPAQRPVFEGLADADKAAVADALQSAGIAHTLDRASGSVTVGDNDYHKARMMLAAQGLPKAAPAGDTVRGAMPMGASRAVEGETLRGAREADLARTIEAIDTVKTARIHLAVPEASPFLRDQAPPAASVMLTLQTGRALGVAQVRAIGHLVASSVPGMQADQVAIVDQSGALLSQRETADDRTLAQQAAIEDRARRAVAALLGPIVGAGNFTAEIHADLDPSESQSTRETFPKDDRALRREEGNRTSSSSSGTLAAIGIPGALSNQPPPASQVATTPGPAAGVTANSASMPAPSGDETYARAFDVGREISVTRQPIGRLRRLTVAVALRDAKGARRPAAELATLEALVKGAVGFDPARGDVVALASRPFADTAAADAIAFYDKPWFMAALRQGGALLAALLAFLFIGRPMIRRLRERSATTGAHSALVADLLGVTAPRSPVTLDMIEAEPRYEARANLVRDFVRQDPAKAANVVRQLMTVKADG